MTKTQQEMTATANIQIVDELGPEDEAMLQALYSRDASSVVAHLNKVRLSGSTRFMDKFYVGYGHQSIGDCGTTSIFLEQVSILAAKAVQDWPLYSGQETSTRYVDMTHAPIMDPEGTAASGAILHDWMDFYVRAQEPTKSNVRRTHPRGEAEDAALYEKAVAARTFDILRAFLPAGICTQLSWHTNLRQAADHLLTLCHHPVSEIRNHAKALRAELHAKYPSSGFAKQTEATHAAYHELIARCGAQASNIIPIGAFDASHTIDRAELAFFHDILQARPRGCVLPHFLSDLGQISFKFMLDYGSFRDIQRHRNGVCRMPVLGVEHGFEDWYLDQLDESTRAEARTLIQTQTGRIRSLALNEWEKQNYIALGFLIPCHVTYALPATVYVVELRSTRFVHPTLRSRVVNHMVPWLRRELEEVPLHIDDAPSDWDIRRGNHTITTKS